MGWRAAVLVVAAVLGGALADLPVHCLHSQVVGDWVLYADEGGQGSDVSCGHMMPDRDDDHRDKPLTLNTNKPRVLQMSLKEAAVVVDADGNRGHWTMVYDEGFEIAIGGYSYFAFSHYHSDSTHPGSNANDCDRTFVGWFHAANGSDWGCYYGVKQGAVPLASAPLAARKSPGSRSLAQEEKWAQEVDYEHVNEDDPASPPPADMHAFIELINTAQTAFKAKYHDHLHNRTVDELRRMMGGFLQVQTETRPLSEQHKTHHGNFNISEYPKAFDWRNVDGKNFDSPFKYQGFCGSCYSMATVQMLETRVRVQTKGKERVLLSTQDAVSCSRYNQGCDGGYPFLVAKHAQDFNIVPEECFPYAPGSECDTKCSDPTVRVSVSEYYYLGGFYGGCTEAAMVQELVDQGPFVASFNAGSDFMFYSGGVYTQSQWGDSFLQITDSPEGSPRAEVRAWEKTTHSVLVVGYGEDPAEGKYWIAKNTWGEQWGEDGYFRIKRGTDESAFESMALAAVPVLHHVTSSDLSASQLSAHHPHKLESFGHEASLLQEGEGGVSSEEQYELRSSDPRTNPELSEMDQELGKFDDPAFSKEYTSIRRPHMSNDYGAPLHSARDKESDDDEDEDEEQKAMEDNSHDDNGADHHPLANARTLAKRKEAEAEQHTTAQGTDAHHHGHHHDHHGHHHKDSHHAHHGDAKHHHHHHGGGKDKGQGRTGEVLLEALQEGEGVVGEGVVEEVGSEFADPADSL